MLTTDPSADLTLLVTSDPTGDPIADLTADLSDPTANPPADPTLLFFPFFWLLGHTP